MIRLTTLISLISEQTLPNVLFAKEKGAFDRYVFITTQEMENKQKTNSIIRSLELPSSTIVVKKQVLEDSIQNIQDKIKEIDFDDNEEIIINLTGGNKIMAIAVHNYFINKNPKIFYIPYPKNSILQIHPEVRQKESILQYRVSLSEYLITYGINFNLKGTALKEFNFTKTLLNNRRFDANIIGKLRDFSNETFLRFDDSMLTNDQRINIETVLRNINFVLQNPNQINQKELKYLTGGWFEEYIFGIIVGSKVLRDEDINLNIEIFKPQDRNQQNITNEFDVMFTYNNALYVVECKMNIKDKLFNSIPNDFFNNTVHKLAAIRQNFGLSVKSYIITLSSTNNFHKEKAKYLGIALFDRQDFSNNLQDFINTIN